MAAGKRKSTVKVLDLGLAKVVELTTAATPDPLKFPTKAGVVLGTPRYMAPEQVGASGLVDARADLYAVGLLRTRGGAPSPADREPPALESFESLGGRRVGGHLFLQASEPPWDFSNAVSAASYREMTAAFCELASPAQSVLAECKRLEALHHG
ncbi:MAG: hypothetical protein KC731_32925 [Myxococcales bacterium]|nr:hypothetical protein [Myxococcales bacterium]